jgi:hypothetical protein
VVPAGGRQDLVWVSPVAPAGVIVYQGTRPYCSPFLQGCCNMASACTAHGPQHILSGRHKEKDTVVPLHQSCVSEPSVLQLPRCCCCMQQLNRLRLWQLLCPWALSAVSLFPALLPCVSGPLSDEVPLGRGWQQPCPHVAPYSIRSCECAAACWGKL